MCMNIPAKMFKISPIITSPTDQPIVKSMVFPKCPDQKVYRGRRDRMVVGFTITCAIGAYHH
jgi:hypothetical protein